ncbi:NADH-quinone oxidoreductase subunit J [Buchnera aphidicola]|uniref:NADH-quinone oxidoreductase subunit J family protein n=1 Tax=Buchnera aphidicola TaxID=9 RepID=UPI00094C4C04|nr:NADH-quinone oxidoreductase subunit J [Buchnera aphidicola]
MSILFYFFSFFSVLWIFLILINNNLIYVLLYFVLFIFSLSGIFFTLGSYFLGALEIIIYAGSIVVLFLFIIMLIDFNKNLSIYPFRKFFSLNNIFLFCFFIPVISFLYFQYNIISKQNIFFRIISIKDIGFCFFRKYCFLIELASLLLLSSVILVCFFIKNNRYIHTIINKGLK